MVRPIWSQSANAFSVPDGGTIVLNNDNAFMIIAPYRVTDNPWGKGALVRGVDYTETITIHTASYPSGVIFNYSWPTPGTGAVMAYPFVEYSPSRNVPPYPTITSLTTCKTTHNFLWTTTGRSWVLYDTWLFTDSTGASIAFEVEYYPATRGYNAAINQTVRSLDNPYISLSGLNLDIYNYTAAQTGSWAKLQVYPTTLQTNQWTNPNMTGSVNGTPGTPPTSTSVGGTSGLSSQIVGSGTTLAGDGTSVTYVDIRFFGTSGAGTTNEYLQLDGSAFGFLIPWTPSQNAWFSSYLAIVAGSFANISSCQLQINGYDNTGVYVMTTGTQSFTLTMASALQHFGLQFISQANIANLNPQIYLSMGAHATVDVTLRIGNVALSNDISYAANWQTMDWKAFFTACTSIGVMLGTECLQTIQLGPEIINGSGNLNISAFSGVQS